MSDESTRPYEMTNVFTEGTPRHAKWVDALHRANYEHVTLIAMAKDLMALADTEQAEAHERVAELIEAGTRTHQELLAAKATIAALKRETVMKSALLDEYERQIEAWKP